MNQRRLDLDWLRIIALGLLILYHTGMFYVSWDWHVKSSRASETIEPLMQLLSPWRLALLFLISGAATRFLADKMTGPAFTKARMVRLVPPLALAIFVIVPPQTWYEVYEVVESGLAPASALDGFYERYVTSSGHWCAPDECIITPTYNHMWFVFYLVLYTLLVPIVGPLVRRATPALDWLTRGPGLLIAPWLVMFGLRVTLFPVFGETHNFMDDFYLHALYLFVFFLGFALAKHQPFFDRCVRARWVAVALALACWIGVQTYFSVYTDADVAPSEWLRTIMRGVYTLQAWSAIIAALGFAHRYLSNTDNRLRRVLTEAIFPFYLIHQTIIVVAGHHLDALGLPLWLEAVTLIGITVLGCWLFYATAKRISWLRLWAGLSPREKAVAAAPHPALASGE